MSRAKERGFLKTLLYSFSPVHYQELIADRKRDLFKHYLFVLLFFIVISSILFIPTYSNMAENIREEFGKFEEFKIETTVTTNEPADFGFLVIDTPLEIPPERDGVVISDTFVQIKILPFVSAQRIKTEEFKDILANTDVIVSNVVLLMITLIPYFIMMFFFAQALKIGIWLLVYSVIIFLVGRLIQENLTYNEVIRISGYASVFLMLELLIMPFQTPWFIENIIPALMYLSFVFITIYYLKNNKRPLETKREEKVEEEFDIFRGSGIRGV